MSERRPITLVANTAFNIANFRLGLVESLIDAGQDVVCVTPDEDFWPGQRAVGLIEGTGARYVELPMDRGGTNPITDTMLLVRLFRLYRRLRPKLLLHYTLKPVVYGSVVARLLRIPSVAVVTGQGSALANTSSPLARLTRGLLRFSLRRATCVFFLNPVDYDEFVSRNIVTAGKARVLPGEGIDTDHFQPAESLPEVPTFLMVARLLRDKGVYEYVEAARRVKELHPEARFLLGGALDPANPSGVDAAELAAWQEEGNIEYLGVVDDPRPWYASASAVVLPSYREGMSRVLLEAIACGLPVLASDVPGCQQLVEHGESGFLFPPRDVDALTDHMKRFLKLPFETQLAFGSRGRERAVAEFGQDRVNRVYMEALPHLVQDNCSPTRRSD